MFSFNSLYRVLVKERRCNLCSIQSCVQISNCFRLRCPFSSIRWSSLHPAMWLLYCYKGLIPDVLGPACGQLFLWKRNLEQKIPSCQSVCKICYCALQCSVFFIVGCVYTLLLLYAALALFHPCCVYIQRHLQASSFKRFLETFTKPHSRQQQQHF